MSGHLKKRGPNCWLLVIELPRTPEGKRRQFTRTVRGSRRDADRFLSQLLADHDHSTLRAPSRLTLAEFLARWLADEVAVTCRPTTQATYARNIRLHLEPALGSVRLESLTPAVIQHYYAQKGRALGPSTLNLHHTILHAALETAVRWRLLAENPASAVTPPRKREAEPVILSPAQFRALLAAARGTRYFLPILLAAGLGIREGEILGLRLTDARLWQDEQETWRGLLIVERTLQRLETGLGFGPRKGKKPRLEFPLPPIVAEALATQPANLDRHRAEWGSAWEDHDLFCPGERGRPWHPSSFRTGFLRLLERRGLPRMRFHDTRHCHATLLLLSGVPLAVVSKRLGHARQSTTSDIYSHLLEDSQAEASEVIERLLRAG